MRRANHPALGVCLDSFHILSRDSDPATIRVIPGDKVFFVQLADGTPRSEVWRALHGAATLQSNCGKIVIAVSEDIDPASMDAVLWSLAYRTNPIEDVHLVPHRGGVQGAQYGPKTADSGMLVDAKRKYPMAPLALPTNAATQKQWPRLLTTAMIPTGNRTKTLFGIWVMPSPN